MQLRPPCSTPMTDPLGAVHPRYRPPVGHLLTIPAADIVAWGSPAERTQRVRQLQRLRQARARAHFPSFVEYIACNESTGEPVRMQWFHDEWSEAMDVGTRVLIIACRNSGKTSQVVWRVIWELGRNPDLRIKIACAADGRAKERLFEISQHITHNPRVREVFPALEPDPNATWSKHALYIKRTARHRDASVEALGITATATGGRCVVPGTEVVTAHGLRAIETIEPGTRVLGADGKYHPVAQALSREYTGEVIRVHVEGACTDAVLTPEHPVMVYGMVDGLPTYQWRPAGELRPRDLVVFPRRMASATHKIFARPEVQAAYHALSAVEGFWRFLGYFLGDGWVPNHERISGHGYSLSSIRLGLNNTTKADLIEDVRQFCERIGAHFHTYERDKCVEVSITHRLLADICRKFGHRAENKFIPAWVTSASALQRREFLNGYARTDGHCIDRRIGFVSVSKDILTQVQGMLFDAGYSSGVKVMREAGESTIQGRICQTQKKYMLESSDPGAFEFLGREKMAPELRSWDSMRRVFFTPNHALIPVRTVKREEYRGLVYDLSVPASRTFCTPSMIVHNCDLLIADDVVDRRNALSMPALREQVKQAWKSDWTNLLEPDSRIWYIATLWHRYDLTHELMANPEFRCLDYSIGPDMGAIWPEKWPEHALRARQREIGSVEFNRAFMNRVIDADTAVFREGWLRFADLATDPAFQAAARAGELHTLTSYDTATAVGDDADYSAGVALAVHPPSRRCYVLDAWHARQTVAQQAAQIYREHQHYRPHRVLIEKAGQAVVDEWLLSEHPELRPVVETVHPTIGKVQRAQAITPLFERGEVTFSSHLNPDGPTWQPGREAIIHELRDFPVARNDDQCDALVQGLAAARRYFLDAWAPGVQSGEMAVTIGRGGQAEDAYPF